MIRNLSAFVWLRWRTAMNRISSGDRRDWLEQLSRIGQTILPWISVLLLLPSILALGIASFYAGVRMAADGDMQMLGGGVVFGTRIWLWIALFAIILGPVARAGRDRDSGLTRLLLLPIRRESLHWTEVLSGFADFWIALLVPLLLGFPLGLIGSGRWDAGLIALATGAFFLLAMASLNSAISYGVGLLLRKRRRAEWITFVFMSLLVLGFMLPGAWNPGGVEIRFSDEEKSLASGDLNVAMDLKLPRPMHGSPGELCIKSAVLALDRQYRAAAWRGGAVALWAFVLFRFSWWLYLRRIRNPDEESARGDAGVLRLDGDPPFGLSTALWEVSRTTVRLALRTVRGKLAIFLNFPIIGLTAYLVAGQDIPLLGEHPLLQLGLIASTGGIALCILSLHTVLVNQFAVDGGGLARQWLAPIRTRTLVYGKALAGALMLAVAVALCFVAAALAAPADEPALWLPWLLLLPLVAGSYALLAPLHTMLSAIFPKEVNLSKMGQEGNPHIAAALLGVALTALVVWVGALAIAGGYLLGDSLTGAWVVASVWCLGTGAVGWGLLQAAIGMTRARRENLLLVAAGR